MTDINELEDNIQKNPMTKEEAQAWVKEILNHSKIRQANSKKRRRDLFAELAVSNPEVLEKIKKERSDIFK